MADTIAAISTGNVLAGIGILRLSGEDAISIVDKVFKPSSGKPMSERKDRSLVYGELFDKTVSALTFAFAPFPARRTATRAKIRRNCSAMVPPLC